MTLCAELMDWRLQNMENIVETEKEIEKVVKLTLIRIGIKCDHVGFTFLTQSVKEVIANPELIHDLRRLFTIVAEKCGAKDFFRVEANMHNAIAFTYKTKGFGKLYGMEVLKAEHKPTTAEVIRLVAEYYSLGLYKNDYAF